MTAVMAGCGNAGLSLPAPSASPAAGHPLDVVIPAYNDPTDAGYWQQVLAAAPTVSDVVLNPADGPGSTAAPGYRELVDRLRQAGIRPLGYVATGHGGRAAQDVTADIAAWNTWYGVRDVFLDEASALASGLAAYRGYAAAVHRQQGVVVLNPGDVPDPGYFAFADGVVTFEDPLAHFLAERADPAWLRRRPPAQRWGGGDRRPG